jgi:hypothetical protein
VLRSPKSADTFMSWVWPLLKMNVYLINNTPYDLTLYWLDGNRGIKQPDIRAGDTYKINTFISHSFYARASFVGGNRLTNEVSSFYF